MGSRTRSTRDRQDQHIISLQKQVAAQQTIIENLKVKLARAQADARNAYGLLDDERDKFYRIQPMIKEQRNIIDRLEREQQGLVNQLESSLSERDKMHVIQTALWAVSGMLAGASIGRYWEVLWQLG